MKKALLFAFFLLGMLTASAQVSFKPGIRAGVNFANITHTDLDYKTDFYVGGYGALKLSRFYTMQPEISYTRQGGEGDIVVYDYNSNTYFKQHVDVSLEYFSFALANKFTLNDNFNVHIGPTFEVGMNTRNGYNDDVDLGFLAGLGYEFPFGLGIEARVKKGLVDVVDGYYYDDSGYDYEDVNSNLVFQVGLTYSFNVTGSSK